MTPVSSSSLTERDPRTLRRVIIISCCAEILQNLVRFQGLRPRPGQPVVAKTMHETLPLTGISQCFLPPNGGQSRASGRHRMQKSISQRALSLKHYLALPPRVVHGEDLPEMQSRDPDDGALFCHTCGNRLPPRIPEKTGILCPRCGTLNTDMQAVFCNTCGSPLQIAPQGQARDSVLPGGMSPAKKCPGVLRAVPHRG